MLNNDMIGCKITKIDEGFRGSQLVTLKGDDGREWIFEMPMIDYEHMNIYIQNQPEDESYPGFGWLLILLSILAYVWW